MKHRLANSLPEKIILAIVALIVLTYILFISVPILAVFLKIEPSQINNQLRDAGIIEAIKLSLITAGIATVLAFVLAVPTAYFMVTRNFPRKSHH